MCEYTMCVCVCVRAHACVCVYVCVCACEKVGDKKKQMEMHPLYSSKLSRCLRHVYFVLSYYHFLYS